MPCERRDVSHLRDGLELLVVFAVRRQQIRTVHTSTLSLPKVPANGHQVKGVGQSVHVVAFQLQPVKGALGGFVHAVFDECFHHEALTVAFDSLLQERLDFIQLGALQRFRELELSRDVVKGGSEQALALLQRFVQQRLCMGGRRRKRIPSSQSTTTQKQVRKRSPLS